MSPGRTGRLAEGHFGADADGQGEADDSAHYIGGAAPRALAPTHSSAPCPAPFQPPGLAGPGSPARTPCAPGAPGQRRRRGGPARRVVVGAGGLRQAHVAVLAAEAVVTSAAAEAVGACAAVEGGVVLAHDVVVAVAELRGRRRPCRCARPARLTGPRAVGAGARRSCSTRQRPSQAPQVRQQGGQRARGLGARGVGRARPGLAGGGSQQQDGPEEQEGRHEARRRSDGAARLSGESKLEGRAGERWPEVGKCGDGAGEDEEGGPREGRRMESERMDEGERHGPNVGRPTGQWTVCVCVWQWKYAQTRPENRVIMGGQKGSTGVMGGEKVCEEVRQVDKTRGHL